jgi:hypothetical protein
MPFVPIRPRSELEEPGMQLLGRSRSFAAGLPLPPLPRGRIGATSPPQVPRNAAPSGPDPMQLAFDALALGSLPVASALTPPVSWGDLGQCSSGAGRYLICELTSPIAVGTEPCYRLGPPGAERSSTDRLYSYQWTVRRRSDNRQVWQTVTASPEIRITAAAPGEYSVEVVVLSDGTPGDVCLALDQDVKLEAPALTAELGGTSSDVARAMRELVTDLHEYIALAAAATGPRGIPARLLASVLYIEILSRPKASRESELDHAAVLLNAPVLTEQGEPALFTTRSPDRPLGVGQIRPMTAAMVLGATPWIDQDRSDRRSGRELMKASYEALPLETKRQIFTHLRWPKSNIGMAARLLAALKNRAHRFPALTGAQLAAEPRAVALLATEYVSGATRTPAMDARPSGYGSWVWQQMQESFMRQFFTDTGEVSGR